MKHRLHNIYECSDVLDCQGQTQPSSHVSISQSRVNLAYMICKYTQTHAHHTQTCLHIFIGTWHVPQLRCPFASSCTCLPKMSHWIFNMWTNLMMAGTQSMMALIIQASTAESSRPPQGLWLLPQNLLTSISFCSSFLTPLHLGSPRYLPLVLSRTLTKTCSSLSLHSLHCLFKSVCLPMTLNAHCMSIYSKLV